jgi:hypothetical protein
MTAYIVSSMLWSLAGLVVGYALGSAGIPPIVRGPEMFSQSRRWRLFSRIRAVEARMSAQEERWFRIMAKNKDALAALDAEIEKLREYVRSDDETDAAEVDKRTADIRQLLAEAQGGGEVPTDETAQRESDLAEVVNEANKATGATPGQASAGGGRASSREAGNVDPPEGQTVPGR